VHREGSESVTSVPKSQRTYEGRILTAGNARKCTSFLFYQNGQLLLEIIFVTDADCATLFEQGEAHSSSPAARTHSMTSQARQASTSCLLENTIATFR
jgi:hypothetical protein